MRTFFAARALSLPFFLYLSAASAQNLPPADHVPPLWPYRLDSIVSSSPRAMVVSDDSLATGVGLDILRQGGNAIDAAVATAFALAVVLPGAGNIGGGGFLVTRLADGTCAALDFRETAPHRASRDMYLDAEGRLTTNSVTGSLSAGVPGSVAGLWEAHRSYGELPWQRLIEPAIALAEQGFIVDNRFSTSVREDSTRLTRFPASRSLYFPEGVALKPGSLWRNPELAATLRRIASDGPTDFYTGRTAELIVEEMRREHGIISHEDLSGYVARWRTPLRFAYRGDTVITMPLPSSGGITLALIANIASGFDLHALGWHSTAAVHLVAEAMRRAFADRNGVLGDPDFVHVPVDTLLSAGYAAERRATISLTHATPSADVHPIREGNHTTHFSIVDDRGNAVALTTTLNLFYGSAVTVTGAGFLLNDEMDDFAVKPGSPNVYGLVQGEADAIAPGKRVLSSMTPTIVLNGRGQPILVTGASGGPRIISAVFQVMSNIVDFDFPAAAAVNAPRFHQQHLPDKLYIEEQGFTSGEADSLRAQGYTIEFIPRVGIAASIVRQDSLWWGAADPRAGR